MAEGAGAVLRSGGGGRVSGAEPEVDGARAGPQGTAETAKYTKNEQKKTRTDGKHPQGRLASAGPAGRTRARAKAGSEWEFHVEIEWIGAQLLTPHFGGLSAGRGGGGAAMLGKHRPKRASGPPHRTGLPEASYRKAASLLLA